MADSQPILKTADLKVRRPLFFYTFVLFMIFVVKPAWPIPSPIQINKRRTLRSAFDVLWLKCE
ncbi:MAG: hypothetical protein ACM3PS_05220 [Syntrophothermus sp.]